MKWRALPVTAAFHLGCWEVDTHTRFDMLGQHGLLRIMYGVCNQHTFCRGRLPVNAAVYAAKQIYYTELLKYASINFCLHMGMPDSNFRQAC